MSSILDNIYVYYRVSLILDNIYIYCRVYFNTLILDSVLKTKNQMTESTNITYFNVLKLCFEKIFIKYQKILKALKALQENLVFICYLIFHLEISSSFSFFFIFLNFTFPFVVYFPHGISISVK